MNPIKPKIWGLFDDGREESFETEQSLDHSSDNSSSSVPEVFEKAFEGAEFILNPVAEAAGDLVKEASSAVGEIFKDIFAPMEAKGKIDNFQNPEKQKAKNEGQRQRMVFSSLEEARRNAQLSAHEAALDMSARMEIAGMSSEEKNKELHLSLDFDEKNISDPYHLTQLMKQKKEQLRQMEQQELDSSLASSSAGAGLRGRLDAQEGQSLVSSSGAIMGAG